MGYSIKNAALVATVFMAASTNAHMIMKSPVPYGASTLNNSPLEASGDDFPCKQRPGVYDAEGASNILAIGEPQTLSFTGSAVHGGGSCQVSLTTDLQPTRDSKWMVIKSIEGGCPANVAGNLPEDPSGNGAGQFQYTIPDGISPGEYTIAWTWFNKLGNREMYMNCAGATVVGAKSKRYASRPKIEKRADFPNMFVANLAKINDCKTPEGFDYNFQNPGSDVASQGVGPYTMLKCAANGGGNAPQQPTGSAPQQATGSAPQQPTASVPAAGSPANPAIGKPVPNGQYTPGAGVPGVFASGAVSASGGVQVIPVTVSPASPAAPTGGAPVVSASQAASQAASMPASSPQVAQTQATAAPAPVSAGSSTAGGSLQSGACTSEGQWSCSGDGESFQRCASSNWSPSIPLAAGMKCVPGLADNLNMSAA
jgi:hypothetical protein